MATAESSATKEALADSRGRLLSSDLKLDPKQCSIKLRNSAGYMVAQVYQYSSGSGPVRADAEVYAGMFAAAPHLLAVVEALANSTQSEATPRLREMARAAIANMQAVS